MKYCFMILVLCTLLCACASKKDDGYYSYKNGGILEEEFDLLIAPKMDYDNVMPYEEQIKNTVKEQQVKTAQTTKPKAKPQKQPVKK